MEILRSASLLWSLAHTLVLLLLLFEPRYPQKKTYITVASTMIPLVLVNVFLFHKIGAELFGAVMLFSLSLPSCIVFWFLSMHRDGRFFFTFCMIDTVVLEIIYISNILNVYLAPDSVWILVIIRLIAYPLLVWFVIKKVRPVLLGVLRDVNRGWGTLALIGAAFYLVFTFLMANTDPLTHRPQNVAALCVLFILLPSVYAYIILTLRRLQRMHALSVQENILKIQVSSLTTRMDELAEADERFRVERHNFRHKLKTIAGMIKKEQYEECLNLLSEYEGTLNRTKIRRYCNHTILDAMLSSYIPKAQDKGICIDAGFDFPDEIPVDEAELATAIANALENAINACEKVSPEERFIEIKAISRPRFMMRISNSYTGEVAFNADGIPINTQEGHGIGTRFIAAFSDKNNGFYQFSAEDGVFTLMLNF